MSDVYAYYPGCSLHGTAVEYEESTLAVCEALGVELREIPDWNCCGSSSAHMMNHWLALSLPARNIKQAAILGVDTITIPCPSCLANMKRSDMALRDENLRPKVEWILGEAFEKSPDMKIEHTLETLSSDGYRETIKSKITRPLEGLKVVAYYGCLLTRPADVAQFDDTENPTSMDELLSLTGAEVLEWPGKVCCCGASLPMSSPEDVWRLGRSILIMAKDVGADAIVTACPMCHSNLDTRQDQIKRAYGDDFQTPIFYFTELIGLAMGIGLDKLGIQKHLVDSVSLLKEKGLVRG